VDDHVCPTDGGGPQRLPASTTSLPLVGVEGVEVGCRELPELSVTQHRLDARVDLPSVLTPGRRRPVRSGVLVPPLEELAEGAGDGDVVALADLRDEPGEFTLGLTLRPTHGLAEVSPLARELVTAGVDDQLEGIAPLTQVSPHGLGR
jgi:hypothetical protein